MTKCYDIQEGPREHALDELKIGGDPQKAVAYALIHLADQFGQPAPAVIDRNGDRRVTWTTERPTDVEVAYQGQSMASDQCHCGASFGGSDHCPACGCEIYERYCNYNSITGRSMT